MSAPPGPPPVPPLAAFVGSELDPRRQRLAGKVLGQVLRRRTWALLRHVHLVAAFDEVRARRPVASVLAVGCGAGLSELFLALAHPEVHFTLTDHDDARLDVARRTSADLGLDNVVFRELDLLEAPTSIGYDLVTGIEVLEHIEDDRRAVANLLAMTGGFAYQLVPHCREIDLTDAGLAERVWQRHGHHRPGYTERTAHDLFAAAELIWVRRCYHQPFASELRRWLQAVSDDELGRDRDQVVARGLLDLGPPPPGSTGALGLEVLVRVDAAGAAGRVRP